mgnify:CR=1 FL=1
MKKIFLGLLALGTLLMSSCYEDKGNYSYNFDSINNVDTISFTPEAYSSFNGWTIDYIKSGEADTITERITVNPTFSSPEQAGEMDYYWYRRYTWNGTNRSDTLNTPGYMDVLIPNNGDVTYNVILEIRDRITDISYFTNLTVRTREWYTNSLFVLHGNSATNMRLGNVEILGEEPTITLDAFERVNTDPTLHEPFRNARVLSFRVYASKRSSELIVFKTDATAEVYNPFGLKRLQDTYYVMPPTSGTADLFVPRSIINLSPSGSQRFRAVTSNDGRFYISSDFFRFYEPGADTENANHLTTDQYNVHVGTMTSEYYVFWDEQNGRFIHNSLGGNNFPWSEDSAREDAVLSSPVLDSHVNSDILKALKGMQPVYAYVNNFNYYQSANEARFIFYDPATQRNLICSLVQSDGKDGKSAKDDESDASSPFEADTISMPNIHLEPGTPIVYQGAYALDFFFYADGSTVYRYNIQNGDQEIIYEAPAGYDISILKFKQNEDYLYWGNLYRYLNIGMNRGNEGAVAEIKLTAAGDVDTEYEQQLYEGFDNIVDLQFCNELQYNVE